MQIHLTIIITTFYTVLKNKNIMETQFLTYLSYHLFVNVLNT